VSIAVTVGEDRIARVTLDNPTRRNALNLEMFKSLAELWPRLDADPRVRCVLLRGAGDEAFCSGADLSANLNQVPGIDTLIDKALLKTRRFRKPIIAAINGHCVAGGLELALSADLRAVRQGAKLGLPEVCWGIFPSGGAAMKLPDQISYTAAMEMLLTGRLIESEEARELGLVSRVLAVDELDRWAEDRARAIAANSPVAVRAVKSFVNEMRGTRLDAVHALETELVRRVRCSGQLEEGIAAFLEKRTPAYRDEDA
jgi:enoyl-CoA hydratase